MINVQGTFDDGRGASGLGYVPMSYGPSRLGPGVRAGGRPPHMKPAPPSSVDMRSYAPARSGKPGQTTSVDMRSYAPARRSPRRIVKVRHRSQFINWLKRWAPRVYADAKRRADVAQAREGTLNGLGGWWDTFTDSVSDLGGKYLQFKTQKEILDAQMNRMQQGLPPLQTSEYAPTIAVKPDAGTTREITGAIGAGLGQFIPWAAAGLGLYLLVGRKR